MYEKDEMCDKFYVKILNVGSSTGLIIPYNVVVGNDYKVGDEVVVWLKRR